MPEKEGGGYGDDDEWGDLIMIPNRLFYDDDFYVLKAEKFDNSEQDEQEEESRGCSDGNSVEVGKVSSSSSAVAWPQLLTIPSGINPTELLDSSVLLPNSQGSPTTGAFPFTPPNHEIIGINSAAEDCSSFQYRSPLWPYISDLQNQPMASELQGASLKEPIVKGCATGGTVEVQPSHNNNNQTSPIKQSTHKETSLASMKNSEDGYNWRKYGQKQVKGSEYPRSYYKCTHPNCLVKKKVERSHDGHITEIIYKGAHNHQVPHLGQRNINAATQFSEANGTYVKIEDGDVWGNVNQGSINNITLGQDWAHDGLERSSSTSILTDNSDLISPTRGNPVAVFDSMGNPDLSSFNNNGDVNEEDGTHMGTLSDDDKSDLKRRCHTALSQYLSFLAEGGFFIGNEFGIESYA